ncbi:MAG: hypothetical protein AAF483_31425, partial [Planctomycetota bacterium]
MRSRELIDLRAYRLTLATAGRMLWNMTRSRVIKYAGRAMLRGLEEFPTESESEIRTFYDGPLFDPLGIRNGLVPQVGIPACGLHPASSELCSKELVGRTLFFDLDGSQSCFGDILRAVDTPEEKRADPRFPVFGWSGDRILGGYLITSSYVTGRVAMRFESQIEDGFLPFQFSLVAPLSGTDGLLTSPSGYGMATRANIVSNATVKSSGRLQLRTGKIYDFHLNLRFYNTAIFALLGENPKIKAPDLLFPGAPQAGHVLGHLLHDEMGLHLDIHSSQFLPLGHEFEGEPVRMPPSRPPFAEVDGFLARGTSLQPYIRIKASTHRVPKRKAPFVSTQAGRHLENQEVRMLCVPGPTCFGDDFSLVSDRLGGAARGWSPLFGSISVQFGSRSNARIPYVLSFHATAAYAKRKLRKLLSVLPPGSQPGLIGMRGTLEFPLQSFEQANLSLNSDPQKYSIGHAWTNEIVEPSKKVRSSETHQIVVRSF